MQRRSPSSSIVQKSVLLNTPTFMSLKSIEESQTQLSGTFLGSRRIFWEMFALVLYFFIGFTCTSHRWVFCLSKFFCSYVLRSYGFTHREKLNDGDYWIFFPGVVARDNFICSMSDRALHIIAQQNIEAHTNLSHGNKIFWVVRQKNMPVKDTTYRLKFWKRMSEEHLFIGECK